MNAVMIQNMSKEEIERYYDSFDADQLKAAVARLIELLENNQ